MISYLAILNFIFYLEVSMKRKDRFLTAEVYIDIQIQNGSATKRYGVGGGETKT